MARGMNRRVLGPWSTVSVFTNSASTSTRPPLFSALATAERSSLARCGAAACGVNLSIARAAPTGIPRTWSATSRTLRGVTRSWRSVACGPGLGRAASVRARRSLRVTLTFRPGAGVAAVFFWVSAMSVLYLFGGGAEVAATAFFSPV